MFLRFCFVTIHHKKSPLFNWSVFGFKQVWTMEHLELTFLWGEGKIVTNSTHVQDIILLCYGWCILLVLWDNSSYFNHLNRTRSSIKTEITGSQPYVTVHIKNVWVCQYERRVYLPWMMGVLRIRITATAFNSCINHLILLTTGALEQKRF